ncbi:diguanylate cyclase [Thalassotalea insulae]|uniref:diguanylate cyclase n=1 Tax=Thalassotalea insulae TaxID=2056778 RepID=A0ABQ6GTV5_9GAMM|nr:diguanylate cyclase [Thalassotalea insulae]GLX79376.1 diguanylate cyclase [Thalassotalea insulae]
MSVSVCNLIAEQLNTGILVVDVDFTITEWNRYLQIHANKSAEQVLGRVIFDVFPELPRKWFERKLSSVVQLRTTSFCSWEQRHHLFELPHTRPITTDSHFMAQNCTFLPIENDGEITHICILIEDATDVCHYQSKLNKALEDLAKANKIDGLTQIFNRKHWEECLAKEFARARRYQHGLALIMFDLDHFKLLNDTYGHQCGDMVLIETAKLIQSLLRICDQFGRYGGEEFAVILPETDLIGAIDVAERIRTSLEKLTIEYQGEQIDFSASVGVAMMTAEDQRYEDLISNADIALYQAKSSGRNKVCVTKDVVNCLAM